jgi:hypothetical protein
MMPCRYLNSPGSRHKDAELPDRVLLVTAIAPGRGRVSGSSLHRHPGIRGSLEGCVGDFEDGAAGAVSLNFGG